MEVHKRWKGIYLFLGEIDNILSIGRACTYMCECVRGEGGGGGGGGGEGGRDEGKEVLLNKESEIWGERGSCFCVSHSLPSL